MNIMKRKTTFELVLDWITFLVLLSLAIGISALVARGQTTNQVTVAWDANPETNGITYQVYYDEAANTNISFTVFAGTNLQQVIPPLEWDTDYRFWVTAKNDWDLESDPSEVLLYSVPAEPTMPSAPTAVNIELRILSAKGVTGPFTNQVAKLEYRYTLPIMEVFIAEVSGISAVTNQLALAPPSPNP